MFCYNLERLLVCNGVVNFIFMLLKRQLYSHKRTFLNEVRRSKTFTNITVFVEKLLLLFTIDPRESLTSFMLNIIQCFA